MRRARPGACTWATRARRCSPGWTRAAAPARSSCASRISIGRASPPAPSRACSRISPGWASTGTRARTAAARSRPTARASAARDYDAAIDRLLADGRAFPCACSRADVARAAQAPHEADEDGPRYPGTCRGAAPDEVRARAAAQGRAPAIRFAGDGARIDFVDLVLGAVRGDAAGIDDFVLRRADGTAAYQLAVVVDDAAMAVTRVVRGDDLLRSTPRQLALYRALGLPAPAFAHVPLVLTPSGERLAKRTRPEAVADLRARGIAPETIVAALAASAGLRGTGGRCPAKELIADFSLARIDRRPATIERI